MSERNGQGEENPIVAAVKRSLRGGKPTIVFDIFKSMPVGHLKEWIKRSFDNETIREIGALIIESLLTGDKRMVKTVQDAIKASDHLFNRDREPVLLRKALIYRVILVKEGKSDGVLDPESGKVLDIV